jgi:hypothetical protein
MYTLSFRLSGGVNSFAVTLWIFTGDAVVCSWAIAGETTGVTGFTFVIHRVLITVTGLSTFAVLQVVVVMADLAFFSVFTS